jgi:hypothetical protein
MYVNQTDETTLKIKSSKAIEKAIVEKRISFASGRYKYTPISTPKKVDLSRAQEKHDKKLIFNHALKSAFTESARRLDKIATNLEKPGKELLKINKKNYVYSESK